MTTGSRRSWAVGGTLLAVAAAVAAPVPEKKEPEWKQRFDKVYGLKDGEYVKRVAPPFVDEREEFLLTLFGDEKPTGKNLQLLRDTAVLRLEWDGRRTRLRGQLYWGIPGKSCLLPIFVRELLDLGAAECVIDDKLTDVSLNLADDFVIRKGAPLAKVVPQLQAELSKCGFIGPVTDPPKLELREEEQEVYVVGGKFEIKPRDWRDKDEVDVYADEAVVNKGMNRDTRKKRGSTVTHNGNGKPVATMWDSSGTPAEFVRVVGDILRRRMVWENPPADAAKFWFYHHQRWPHGLTDDELAADRDPEKVLANVTAQTGLTFKKAKRKVPVLYVSVPEKK